MRLVARDVRPYLPPGWQDELASVAHEGVELTLDGTDATSRDVDDRSGESLYRVTTATEACERLPWLGDLYCGLFLEIAQIVDPDARLCNDESAVNVNLCTPSHGYEWHVDPNSPTGLLFGTNGTGGRLLMQHLDAELDIAPMAGLLLMFDAREAPHCVTPVTITERISCPLVYLGRNQQRASDNAYLYGGVR